MHLNYFTKTYNFHAIFEPVVISETSDVSFTIFYVESKYY